MKILITGGTGLVGNHLQQILIEKGYQVVILSRTKRESSKKGVSYAVWDVKNQQIDIDTVCSVDHIIHLAGANIGEGRWTKERKQIIIDSRVKTADLIFKTLKENTHQVKSFISASGADCYGMTLTDKIYSESDDFGSDFLALVCKKWETAANQFQQLGIRTVCLRTGVVCAKNNSALQKMKMPIKLGFGSALGTGNQIMSLIHITDLCSLYVHVLENTPLKGSYNAVSVNKSNLEVTKEIANVLNKSIFMPKVPTFMMKFIFGEMSSILLEGNATDNSKIKLTGFKFNYPSLESILKDTL